MLVKPLPVLIVTENRTEINIFLIKGTVYKNVKKIIIEATIMKLGINIEN